MALQISEFFGTGQTLGGAVTILDGPPLRVSPPGFVGDYVVSERCTVVRIAGSGQILWAGAAYAEQFSGTEYRRLRAGNTFAVLGDGGQSNAFLNEDGTTALGEDGSYQQMEG